MHLQPSHKSDLQSAHFQNRQQSEKQNVKYGHISSSVPKLWHLIMSMKV